MKYGLRDELHLPITELTKDPRAWVSKYYGFMGKHHDREVKAYAFTHELVLVAEWTENLK